MPDITLGIPNTMTSQTDQTRTPIEQETAAENGRLWSLDAMLEIDWGVLVRGTQSAKALEQTLEFDHPIPEEQFRELGESFRRFADVSLAVGAKVTQRAASSLADFLLSDHLRYGGPMKMRVLRGLVGGLTAVIQNEFPIKRSLILDDKYADLFDDEKAFGALVATQFPGLTKEITESAKCLALERSTASAFHALRCLEAGILSVSRCLGIPDPIKGSQRNWGSMLKAVKEEIDNRWPPSIINKGDGTFFEAIHGALAGMQNPYRNATMHLETRYDQDEARRLYEIVKNLMITISARMNEDGLPHA